MMGVLKAVRSLVLLVLLVVGLYVVAHSITKYTGYVVSDSSSEFDRCLKTKNISLYVEDYDIEVLQNLKAADYLVDVDISGCVLNRIDCMRDNVIDYPTWVIGDVKIVGDIDVYTLADVADCEMV